MSNDASLYLKEIPEEQVLQFKNNINILSSKVDELNDKISTFTNSLSNLEIENGLSYLDSKNMFLSLYMSELTNFINFKVQGKYNENIIKNLINMKVTQEKLKVIDTKIKPQLDRMQRLAEGDITEENTSKPRIMDEFENEEEDELEEEKKVIKEKKISKKTSEGKVIKFKNPNKTKEIIQPKSNIDAEEIDNKTTETKDLKEKKIDGNKTSDDKYKLNKLYFHFNETNEEKNNRRKDIEKKKEKLKNSELYRELVNEISDRPEEIGDDYSKSHVGKYMKQVDDYERDMMTRVFVGKKTIKHLRKRDQKDEDLGNFNSELKHLDSIFKYDTERKNNGDAKENAKAKFSKKFKKENNYKKNKNTSNNFEGKSLNKKRKNI